MMEVKDLSYKYPGTGNKFQINNVSMKLEKGYIACLLGKNGCGKTTLLKLIYGMLRADAGEVMWDGKAVDSSTLAAYRRDAAFVGDEGWCSEVMSINGNTELLSVLYPSFDKEYHKKILKLAGLEKEADKAYCTLSKGQRIKAEIAFALGRKPKMLILDEPLANIDPVFKMDILELIQKTVSENDTAVLLSTHLLDEISDIVDQIYVMDNGRILRSGSRFEILGEDGEKSLRDVISEMSS